jgi:crotonobetainyl-CoA:carnitine CoA-transferase CaiB-like acyl-CoA transferase
VLVDVSRQEALASTSHHQVPIVLNDHKVPGAPDARLTAMGWILHARDGDVYLRTVERHQWESLREWMDYPAWSEAIGDLPFYMVDPPAAAMLVGEWAGEHDRAYLLAEGQRRKVPIALPREPAEVLAWDQPRSRGIWEPIDLDGRPAEAPRIPILQTGDLGGAVADADGALLARWQAAEGGEG